MTNIEIRQQNETINTMARDMQKIKSWWPVVTAFIGMATGIVIATLWIRSYDASLVKQPQLARTEIRLRKVDSTLNAKIDTNTKHILVLIVKPKG